MSVTRRDFLKLGSAAALLAAWGSPFSRKAYAEHLVTSRSDPAAYHFLNRISYGVRAADLERCSSIGIEAYLEEQLDPDTLKGRVRYPSLLKADRLKLNKMKNAGDKSRQALIDGMIARAANSPAQLLERMVEFWADHFNISSTDLAPDLVDFQREVIRKYALGNFKDMLFATAHHPAMLFYLNNNENVAKHPNENYARELMELHTLGVNNGYTEADVKAVARAFTGWTVKDDVKPGGFFFKDRNHDKKEKVVLGITLAAGRGMEDGLDVLDILTNHPNTAGFICRKLCVRFVSDTPPQSLVDTLAGVWQTNNGEIKPVLRALFLSPEFAASAGLKLRRPLDFFIGALRLTNAEVRDVWLKEYLLNSLGQVPYAWDPPNGYPDVAAAWANASGLLNRWNASQTLTDHALNDKKSGIKTALLKSIGKPMNVGQLVDNMSRQIFAGPLPDNIRAQMVAYVADDGTETTALTKDIIALKAGKLAALLLSSPMFQWR